jgi:hypothetical protein
VPPVHRCGRPGDRLDGDDRPGRRGAQGARHRHRHEPGRKQHLDEGALALAAGQAQRGAVGLDQGLGERQADAGGQVIVSTATTDRGGVALRVRDTGIGMNPEVSTAWRKERWSASTAGRPAAKLVRITTRCRAAWG